MKLKNFPSWYKWVTNQKDTQAAYRVFRYWVKVKAQLKSVPVNFSYGPIELKKEIFDYYVDEKYRILTNKFKDKYPGIVFGDIISKEIKYQLKSTRVKIKTVYDLMNYMIHSNGIKKEEIPANIALAMEKVHWFCNLKSIDDLRNKARSAGMEMDIEVKGGYAIQYIKSKEDLLFFSSPAWCINFNDKQIDKYHSSYNISFIWEELPNKTLKMYGINYHKDIGYIESIFNHNNEEVYDDHIKSIIDHIHEKNHLGNINYQICHHNQLNDFSKTVLMLLNMADDDLLSIAVCDLRTSEYVKIVEVLLERAFPLKERFYKFMSILKQNNLLTKYIIGSLELACILYRDEVKVALEFVITEIKCESEVVLNRGMWLNTLYHSLKHHNMTNDLIRLINMYENIFIKNENILEIYHLLTPEIKVKILNRLHTYNEERITTTKIDYKNKSNIQLIRKLFLLNKINVRHLSNNNVEYEIFKNIVTAKERVALFLNLKHINVDTLELLYKDGSLDSNYIISSWIDNKLFDFKTFISINNSKKHVKQLMNVYLDEDFEKDESSVGFMFKMGFENKYYQYRKWLHKNNEYIEKIIYLIKSGQLDSCQIKNIFAISSNKYSRNNSELMLRLVKESLVNSNIVLYILNKLKTKKLWNIDNSSLIRYSLIILMKENQAQIKRDWVDNMSLEVKKEWYNIVELNIDILLPIVNLEIIEHILYENNVFENKKLWKLWLLKIKESFSDNHDVEKIKEIKIFYKQLKHKFIERNGLLEWLK
jgi:hypothetical protein